jgi:hypothetical protein
MPYCSLSRREESPGTIDHHASEIEGFLSAMIKIQKVPQKIYRH